MTTDSLDISPKLRGRPREFDMDAALDEALRVFSERGYYAASISELTEAMGLTAGSVYKAFGDKRGVFLATFDRYRKVRRGLMEERLSAAPNGYEKLRALVTFYAESSCGDIGRRGCLVVGSATELALFDEEAASRVAFAFETDEQHLVDLIRLGQTDGSVPNHVNAENTARTMHCLMKGMRLIGKTGRTREQMTTVLETAMTLLN
ncbi:TetR/AcrR family transcriptional regulator [Agrobacterium sp. SHOUNA12C]|uniref:Transcriptional regulator protein n=2 Tax=Rhizobium rhizogenes TaxID=359 RepID=B9JGI5_RHIR8|nr:MULTISPECIES: TetR/AcrR family transcriptional regulator [Rhizobium]ACM26959.1 transcriptional regulator protein [Rhizobium rhizogenes K84]KAA6489983.1 TetR/AcrR family transcriptional regulator [Agrobacterium sp. ICMP 7243]MCJ9720180.1 TetR/AcrR family transcriptional regulator [Agrobacterium sp. BETTINA12B]MCJ9755569.1 TetR/AcrR family transcriptional regulator [Agrobacterium sp. SHOUNA12C]OCJ26023.1 TetR family transcriptional regulator [Agrobacterium sp. B131/95]OCJ30879.1 TetR family 